MKSNQRFALIAALIIASSPCVTSVGAMNQVPQNVAQIEQDQLRVNGDFNKKCEILDRLKKFFSTIEADVFRDHIYLSQARTKDHRYNIEYLIEQAKLNNIQAITELNEIVKKTYNYRLYLDGHYRYCDVSLLKIMLFHIIESESHWDYLECLSEGKNIEFAKTLIDYAKTFMRPNDKRIFISSALPSSTNEYFYKNFKSDLLKEFGILMFSALALGSSEQPITCERLDEFLKLVFDNDIGIKMFANPEEVLGYINELSVLNKANLTEDMINKIIEIKAKTYISDAGAQVINLNQKEHVLIGNFTIKEGVNTLISKEKKLDVTLNRIKKATSNCGTRINRMKVMLLSFNLIFDVIENYGVE